MNIDPLMARDFVQAVEEGETAIARGLAIDLFAYASVDPLACACPKSGNCDCISYNDTELVTATTDLLARLHVAPVNEAQGYLIPRFYCIVGSWYKTHAEDGNTDDGEAGSQPIEQGAEEDPSGS